MKKFFEFRKAQISYQIVGKGRTIVLLHGFLGAKEIWGDYVSRLSKKYRLIVLDIPGHGQSESLGYLHHMELLADLVREILHSLKIRKALLIGHSLGGYISLAFAEKYPDSLQGLILLNSTAKGDDSKRKSSRDQLIKLVKQDKTRAIELLVPTFFGLKSRNTHHHIRSYLRKAKNCSAQAIVATVEGMKIRKEREIVLKFAPFQYLFIIGEHDKILDSKDLIEQAMLSPKGSHLLLENSSHMSMMEEREAVYKAISSFAKRVFS